MDKVIIYNRVHWTNKGEKGTKVIGYALKRKSLPSDELFYDVFTEVNGKEKQVGRINFNKETEWESVPFVGDIGHTGIDTLEAAAQDVIEIWREHEYWAKRKEA